MVQMGDGVAVERCVQHLNNIPIGSMGKLQIAYVLVGIIRRYLLFSEILVLKLNICFHTDSQNKTFYRR